MCFRTQTFSGHTEQNAEPFRLFQDRMIKSSERETRWHRRIRGMYVYIYTYMYLESTLLPYSLIRGWNMKCCSTNKWHTDYKLTPKGHMHRCTWPEIHTQASTSATCLCRWTERGNDQSQHFSRHIIWEMSMRISWNFCPSRPWL